MVNQDDYLKELQAGFLEEALDLIDKCEQACLNLEGNIAQNKNDIEILFRCMHTIKGTAASVEMNELSKYTHQVENLLVKVKNKEIPVTKKIVSALLVATDVAKQFIIGEKDSPVSIPDTSFSLEQIASLMKGQDVVNEEMLLPVANQGMIADTLPFSDSNDMSDEEAYRIIKEMQEKCQPEEIHKIETSFKTGLHANERENVSNVAQEHIRNDEKQSEDFIRLPLSKVDHLLDSLGEQVILQTALNYYRENKNFTIDQLDKTIGQLNKITQDLQQTAISLRMFSVSSLFKKAQRIARDTATQIGKEVNIVKIGENAELDKSIIDHLSGPITHLIRNAVDHGIETPEERLAIGKERQGIIELQAFQRNGYFILLITDDGKGIDKQKIIAKAKKQKIIQENAHLSEDEAINLIFKSGFSTKEEASDISGRGVGMDVVKTEIDKLRGSISIKTAIGKGSMFCIKVPLSLAIFNGMVISAGGQRYLAPNSEIIQIIHKSTKEECHIDRYASILRVEDNVYPVIDLARVIGPSNHKQKKLSAAAYLIVAQDNKKYALKIEELIGQQKVVLKKLPSHMKEIIGVSGATILGDGAVALILDIGRIISAYTMKRTA